ncbi:RCC1 domain-containing protein 1 isoform X2 [Xenopus tropicalis]|uniref:RCC1 domain-containing protein 1 isoform X2 n=1 Tax=Xenopus tropicalis TaxID=8364 RepID=A0A8J1J9X9_XENTR|nr:RCC1 domain-containing protein 1 isoform X2 [Xenopus tropicalis]
MLDLIPQVAARGKHSSRDSARITSRERLHLGSIQLDFTASGPRSDPPMPWYGFGYRGFEQLGFGQKLSLDLPEPIQLEEAAAPTDTEVTKAVPAWSYSAFVTEDGSLLLSGSIGASPHKYLSFKGLDCVDVLPTEKYLLVQLKERLQCWDTQAFIAEGPHAEPMWKMDLPSAHNSLFPLVTNGYIVPKPPFFRELPSKIHARKLALGNEHAVLLTSELTVLTWGAGRHGQLGHGDLEDVEEPQIVDALHGVPMSEVAAGGWHSAGISESGDIYTWGWNESGQLGLPCKTQQCSVSTKQSHKEDEMGNTGSGELYSWGWGKYGQLGHGDTDSLDQPKLVNYFSVKHLCVNDVICRNWSTYVFCLESLEEKKKKGIFS